MKGPIVSKVMVPLEVMEGIMEAVPIVEGPVTVRVTVLDSVFVISTTREPSTPAVPLYVPSDDPEIES